MAYGDQPSLICELVERIRSSGFEITCAGKGTQYLPIYHESTPETVWKYYGISSQEAAAGGLVDVGDAVAFSREISRFHADPGLLASCAKEARRYAIAHYSMSSVLDAIESAYRDCVARRAKAVSDSAGRTAGPS